MLLVQSGRHLRSTPCEGSSQGTGRCESGGGGLGHAGAPSPLSHDVATFFLVRQEEDVIWTTAFCTGKLTCDLAVAAWQQYACVCVCKRIPVHGIKESTSQADGLQPHEACLF